MAEPCDPTSQCCAFELAMQRHELPSNRNAGLTISAMRSGSLAEPDFPRTPTGKPRLSVMRRAVQILNGGPSEGSLTKR